MGVMGWEDSIYQNQNFLDEEHWGSFQPKDQIILWKSHQSIKIQNQTIVPKILHQKAIFHFSSKYTKEDFWKVIKIEWKTMERAIQITSKTIHLRCEMKILNNDFGEYSWQFKSSKCSDLCFIVSLWSGSWLSMVQIHSYSYKLIWVLSV